MNEQALRASINQDLQFLDDKINNLQSRVNNIEIAMNSMISILEEYISKRRDICQKLFN